ncbi:hypothetical protein JKY72_04060 [Candidatus Gracilibacteria bacterium]|nr:hypothetical protein [Candidatus Gracilibacteria bacterium]
MQTLAKLSGMDEFKDNDGMNASILHYIREHLTLAEIAKRPTVQFLCRVLADAGYSDKDHEDSYALAQDRLECSTGSDKQLLIVAMLAYLRRNGQVYQAYADLCERAIMNCNMYLSTATLAYDLMFEISDDKSMAMFTPTIINDAELINNTEVTNLSVKLVYVPHSVFLQEDEILGMPMFTRPRCQSTICSQCQTFCNNERCRVQDPHFKRCEQCPESERVIENKWSFELDELEVSSLYHYEIVRTMITARHSMSFIIQAMCLIFDEHGVSGKYTSDISVYTLYMTLNGAHYTPAELTCFVHQIQLKRVFTVAFASHDLRLCKELADMFVMSNGSNLVRERILAHKLIPTNRNTTMLLICKLREHTEYANNVRAFLYHE